ncbi:hypothetical protein JQS43_15010 [Natronosporangium hydrolyticum]|uniref:Uncharacterized protein n=1 Tax=Natronosporangium hydrolyticum TaxID=2811111 RepID=A0A895YCC0_9ACTN|nr:hypothetical protein [Natronosporangium hydrolyticum]QSB12969.1 hypothetical protein JQS43_15010 [Natronosporangium hydrolyticum]
MPTPGREHTRYASAFDLPTVIEIRQQIRGMKALSLLKPSTRPQLRELEAEVVRLASLIDRFYDGLGTRNWIYTDDFNVSRINAICDLPSVDEQEQALIALYREPGTLSFMLRRLRSRPGMRERMALIETALKDYQADRYAGMIHVLISVMDGFVNDLDAARRRGLHARDGDDMTAWDSVVSHHKGLARVHETVFRKPFYKLSTDEVFDLYRHGVVHGNLTSYANVVVATKAWNYLFAVADWAKARELAAKEPEPEPTWGDVLRKTAQLGLDKKALAAWEKREVSAETEGFELETAYAACAELLTQWQRRNYGGMAQHLAFPGSSGSHRKPGEVKDLYKEFSLASFTIHRIRIEAAAVAKVEADLEVNGSHQAVTMRWIYHDDQGQTLVESQGGGRWYLAPYGPTTFVTPRSELQDAQ